MAMSFNHLSDLGLREEQTIDDLFLSQNTSNFDLNHVNVGGLTSCQLSQLLLPSNTALGFHQNDLIPQRNQLSVGLGQLGFGQRVTEVRRTYVTPYRVQVHSFIDYSPLQNQLGIPPNKVIGFSKVTKTTRFLTPTSTMERLFAPNTSVPTQGLVANDGAYVQVLSGNNSVHFQRQPNFRNQTIVSSNQVNHPIFNEFEPFLNLHHHQNRPLNLGTSRIFDLADHAEATSDGLALDPKQLSTAYASLNNGKNPVHDLNARQNSNPSHEEFNRINIQTPNLGKSSRTQNQNDEYDGRTHSLPCKKYGPYKCPKCKGMFDMSQTFAAHMRSHYKHETSAERKRRLAARYKNRNNLRLVHSSDGPTVAPQSLNKEMKVYARKRKGRAEAKAEDEVQKQEQDASPANAEKSHSDLKKVKEESVAENSYGEVKKIKEEPM